MDLKKRYQRLYIPSDFFLARACWLETFPLNNPLDLAKASPIVVFRKHAEQIDIGFIDYEPNTLKKSVRKIELIPEPEDARRLFSAKVRTIIYGNLTFLGQVLEIVFILTTDYANVKSW